MDFLFNNADQVIEGLWLGNKQASQDAQFLKTNDITVIVNCTKDLPFLENPEVPTIKYRVPIDDNLQQQEINNMVSWLAKLCPIIDKHHKQGHKILIHCYAGMQRSAIMMLSYLYQYHGMSANHAYYHIKHVRPIAFSPMVNFKSSFCQRFQIKPTNLNFS